MTPSQHNKARTERLARGEKAALQRIRACCTLQELRALIGAQAQTPALVIQAATQAARVARWPLSPADRGMLLDTLGTLTTQCAMHLERYGLRELASLLAACARAHYTPDALLLPLQLRLAADARRGAELSKEPGAAEHLAALATALSRLGARHPRLWSALGAAALACLDAARPAQLAELLAAHARAGGEAAAASPTLFERATERAAAELRDAMPQDVVTLLWALARCRHAAPRPLRRSVAAHLAARAPEYGALHVASLAGAAARVGLRDAEVYRLLAERGAEALREEASALSSSPRLYFTRDVAGGGGGGGGATAASSPLTSHAVAVLVSGLYDMEPNAHPTEALRAAAEFLMAAAGAVYVEAEHVEQMAAAAARAGLEEERRALLQAYGRDVVLEPDRC